MRRLLPVLLVLWSIAAMAADPTLERLPNDLRLILQPTTSAQVVSIELLIDYSALDEAPSQQGIRQVLLTSMLQGSAAAGGTTIRRSLTAVGGVLEGRVHQEVMEFTAIVPAGQALVGLAALAEIVCRPQLSDAGVADAIAQAQYKLELAPVGALETTSRLTHELLYQNHPFGSRGLGYPDTLAELNGDIIRAAYERYVRPGTAVLALVGRMNNLPDVRAQVQTLFGTWQPGPRAPRPGIDNPQLGTSLLELREAQVRSTCVMLTFPVCGATEKDFLTLRLIDALLGGGTGARLFRSVRESKHLAYEVSTFMPSQANGSYFSLYAMTHSLYLDDTKSALTEELVRLQQTPVPADELQRARAYLKGRYQLSHQFSAQHAFDLAWYELIGQGMAYDRTYPAAIDAITAEDIQRVATTYFTHYYLVVVMPQLFTGK